MSTELEQKYKEFLKESSAPSKIPFIETSKDLTNVIPLTYETTSIKDTILSKNPTMNALRRISVRMNNKTKEKLIQIYQRGVNISDVGRMRGNMEYIEDAWDVQIQSPAIKYAYINKNDELAYSDAKQFKLRDKYIKIKVRYDGTQYAIVNGIKTYYRISYA